MLNEDLADTDFDIDNLRHGIDHFGGDDVETPFLLAELYGLLVDLH